MKKGFTLIELLVLIAILAILSTVVMAGFNSAKMKAQCIAEPNTEECKEFLKSYPLENTKTIKPSTQATDCKQYSSLTKGEIEAKMPIGCYEYFNLVTTK